MSISDPCIERCPHDKENPYAQTSRALIRDPNLHPSVAWMLIYLLSMKDGWKITPRQIINHVKGHYGCGRDKVYDWIKEACEAGYMKKEEWLDGNLKRCRYLLSEYPKFKKSFPRPEDQDPDSSDPVNQDYKKEHPKKTHSKKESSRVGAKESASRTARAPHVSTSSKEHEELVKDFGKERTQEAYERLSEWKEDTPKSKWKKNDHLAIRRWVIDAIKEKALKASKDPENRLKAVKAHIATHPQKEVLRWALKKNHISLEKGSLMILGSHHAGEVIDFKSPSAEEQIDNLIRKLEYRMKN